MTANFIDEGVMPNLKRLTVEGVAAELFPAIPAYTPTNWATLATGADTGTHGAPGWSLDMPDGREVSTFVSCTINAETIWEVAEHAGHKVCIFNYPASMPSRLDNGCVIDNSFGNPQHPQFATPDELDYSFQKIHKSFGSGVDDSCFSQDFKLFGCVFERSLGCC